MRRLWSRRLLRALLLTAALFCWVQALLLSGAIMKSAGSVSFRYDTDGVPGSVVKKMREEERVPFAAWRQRNAVPVEEGEFSRAVTVQIVEVAGDPELVVPVKELRHGFLPVRGSRDTCAVDAATAYALWGSGDVTGETLLSGGKEYTVTGVFSRPEHTVLLQTVPEADSTFPYLEIAVSGLATSRRQADEFRVRYSLPEPAILNDHVETAAMLRQAARLPALLFAALLLWKLLRQIAGKPRSSLGRASFAVAMVTGILIAAWAIGFSPVIPSAAIPGRWSDFSFWSGLIEDAAHRARISRALACPAPDLLRLQVQRSLFLYSGGALAGFVVSVIGKTGRKQEGERSR